MNQIYAITWVRVAENDLNEIIDYIAIEEIC